MINPERITIHLLGELLTFEEKSLNSAYISFIQSAIGFSPGQTEQDQPSFATDVWGRGTASV